MQSAATQRRRTAVSASHKDTARRPGRSGWGLLEMNSVAMSLEDIFLRLTTEEPAAVAN